MKVNGVEVTDNLDPCPTCGDIHPGGVGAGYCDCKDCGLIWTDIDFQWLAPEYQERLKELRAQQKEAANG